MLDTPPPTSGHPPERPERPERPGRSGRPAGSELVAELHAEHADHLVRFLRRRGLDLEEAREVTQKVFTKALERIDTLRSRGAALAWLQTMALNLWRNEVRDRRTRRRNRPEQSLDAEVEDHGEAALSGGSLTRLREPGALEKVLAGEKLQVTLECMEALSLKLRRCLELTAAGRERKQIAILLRVSPETVKSNLSEARKRVTECVEQRFSSEGA